MDRERDRPFSLLLVDDEPRILSGLKRVFFEQDYVLHEAESGEQALDVLERERVDAALLDLRMPGMDGLELLKSVKELRPELMVLMLTGHGGVRDAVEAMRLGALDFLEKPFNADGLRARVAQLYEVWRLRRENRSLKEQLQCRFLDENLVGDSRLMLKLKDMIVRVGPTDAGVLVQGETGTGKELVARAIHRQSPRAKHPFVPVDCASISETVMESELFGHVKGAFTGAHSSTLGLVRSAHGGTLFLDEIGELPPAFQVKLLRTIQEKEVRPVGSDRTFAVDVRLVAATHRELDEEVKAGRFREDLYYRLNVVTLQVPPLRERREDIPLLAQYFLQCLQRRSLPPKNLSPEALACLESHFWPGNVRELENVIQRAAVLGRGELIHADDLPSDIRAALSSPFADRVMPRGDSLEDYERAAIENALKKSGMNRQKAVAMLGIGQATLYRKVKKYGFQLKS